MLNIRQYIMAFMAVWSHVVGIVFSCIYGLGVSTVSLQETGYSVGVKIKVKLISSNNSAQNLGHLSFACKQHDTFSFQRCKEYKRVELTTNMPHVHFTPGSGTMILCSLCVLLIYCMFQFTGLSEMKESYLCELN